MKRAAVIAGRRTPVGKIPGELNYIEETELLSKTFQAVAAEAAALIDEAIVGSAFPVERDNLCRKALLKAGLPVEISCATVSKTCAASDEAFALAFHKILCNTAKTVLVGGVEKVSNSSYTLHFMKRNIKRLLKKKLPLYSEIETNIEENDMAYISEMLARKYQITRRQQDEFTYRSIMKAQEARKAGCFQQELISICYGTAADMHAIYEDELLLYPRSKAQIQEAPPMFVDDGTVTQYNAATMCDCAVSMLLMDYDEAVKHGIKPMAVVRAVQSIGVRQEAVGTAMVECVTAVLRKAHLNIEDIGLFEINESFAAQALYTIEALQLDPETVNVNGGNLALGYPIGATGMRMYTTLLYEMGRRHTVFGLSVMCAGGNMAQAVIFQSVEDYEL